jgi:hypothetical protein
MNFTEAGIPGPRESTDYIAWSRWLTFSHGFFNETNKVAYPIAQWNWCGLAPARMKHETILCYFTLRSFVDMWVFMGIWSFSAMSGTKRQLLTKSRCAATKPPPRRIVLCSPFPTQNRRLCICVILVRSLKELLLVGKRARWKDSLKQASRVEYS